MPVVHYVASEIDFQPQTSPWNYENTMLIKKNLMRLLISSFDAIIRVRRAFHPAPASRGFASHVFLVCIMLQSLLSVFSLSALADVLGALSEQRSHIPYRNTRLTHMLSDTIGRFWHVQCFKDDMLSFNFC